MGDLLLGVDVGGTKTHAVLSDLLGNILGFIETGSGNWEGIGWDQYQERLAEAIQKVLAQCGGQIQDIHSAAFGIAGYDWPCQLETHQNIIRALGIPEPFIVVNDTELGIAAGTTDGWGIALVSGTGCNCRGWSKDRTRYGRVVGGMTWSAEQAGASGMIEKVMEIVALDWTQRGENSTLSEHMMKAKGASSLFDLIEGLYVGRYSISSQDAPFIFALANSGNPDAIKVLKWMGKQLGNMAIGVIRQIGLQEQEFEIVLVGSLWKGSPIQLAETKKVIQTLARGAKYSFLDFPPVLGASCLAAEVTGIPPKSFRENLVFSWRKLQQ
ncbi:MAG: hypothetical protein JXA19_06090 [Anaerolineales bacterium]|nr:hypothetical protein [Anaerolineales bacterium]